MRGHHTGEPLHLRRKRATRDQKLAYGQDGLAGRRDRGRDVRRENAEAHSDLASTQAGNTGFIHEAREPFGGGLANRQAALGYAGALGRKGVEHFAPPYGRDRREAPNDEAIAPGASDLARLLLERPLV